MRRQFINERSVTLRGPIPQYASSTFLRNVATIHTAIRLEVVLQNIAVTHTEIRVEPVFWLHYDDLYRNTRRTRFQAPRLK